MPHAGGWLAMHSLAGMLAGRRLGHIQTVQCIEDGDEDAHSQRCSGKRPQSMLNRSTYTRKCMDMRQMHPTPPMLPRADASAHREVPTENLCKQEAILGVPAVFHTQTDMFPMIWQVLVHLHATLKNARPRWAPRGPRAEVPTCPASALPPPCLPPPWPLVPLVPANAFQRVGQVQPLHPFKDVAAERRRVRRALVAEDGGFTFEPAGAWAAGHATQRARGTTRAAGGRHHGCHCLQGGWCARPGSVAAALAISKGPGCMPTPSTQQLVGSAVQVQRRSPPPPPAPRLTHPAAA
eukprot:363455-Chlamydomonas_euryale.AAC.10